MADWQRLAATSHYLTAMAIREALNTGDMDDAGEGIEELIDSLSKSHRRALYSQLARLMKHIMKWNVQPGFRSRSWQNTILDAREEIASTQEETPSLTDAVIRDELWERALYKAHRDAQAETGMDFPLPQLTWEEVFEREYRLDQN